MKTFHRWPFATLAIAVLFGAADLQAQEPRRGGGPPVSSVQHLLERADDLGLTDQQVSDLQTIQADLMEQSRPVMEQMGEIRQSGDRDTMRSEMRPLMEALQGLDRDATDRALGLMSAEQRPEAEALLETFREERRQRRGRRPIG